MCTHRRTRCRRAGSRSRTSRSTRARSSSSRRCYCRGRRPTARPSARPPRCGRRRRGRGRLRCGTRSCSLRRRRRTRRRRAYRPRTARPCPRRGHSARAGAPSCRAGSCPARTRGRCSLRDAAPRSAASAPTVSPAPCPVQVAPAAGPHPTHSVDLRVSRTVLDQVDDDVGPDEARGAGDRDGPVRAGHGRHAELVIEERRGSARAQKYSSGSIWTLAIV